MMLRKILLVVTSWLALSLPAQATSVLPQTLGMLVDGAQAAFQGVCVSNRTERDAQTGFVVTYTTFDVKDVLKGTVAAQHTIKQIGGSVDGVTQRTEGVPTFAEGDEYIVFLAGVSSAGFSSPLGLFQGSFQVRGTPGGPVVGNGLDFRTLLKDQQPAAISNSRIEAIRASPASTKQIGLEDFRQLVRQQLGKAQ